MSVPASKRFKNPARSSRRMYQGYRAHQRGDLDTALRCYRDVLEADPLNPIALHYVALLCNQLNMYARQEKKPIAHDEAMRLMAASVMAAPNQAAAVHNFAKFKHDCGEIEDARQLYENAVQLDPSLGESWTNLGNILGELGNRELAEEAWTIALQCPTQGASDALFNLSMLRLLRGDFEGGWQDYEARWDCPGFKYGYGRPDIPFPKWNGEQLDGTLLVHAEQGIGDALMMARYIPLAASRADRVIVETFDSTVELFRASFAGIENVEVYCRGEVHMQHPDFRAHIPMMSFPAALRTTVETIPKPVAFGRYDEQIARTRPESGRIGLCWKGSPSHPNDRNRSMPFEALAPLFAIEGEFVFQSLQYGESPAPLMPLDAKNYLDTARAIAECELVITVDTSIAHLAASMGVDTFVLLPIHAEWRWMQDRKDSPWYPTAVLWRQAAPGDWPELIGRVVGAMRDIQEMYATCMRPQRR